MAVPPRRIHTAGTYFVTSRTWESRKLFTTPPVCEIVIEALLHYRSEGEYLLHSFVVMPDHCHILLTPGSEATLGRAVKLIKGGSAHRIGEKLNFKFPVWRRGFIDHRIRDAQDYETHLQYIEQNPVKAGLASSASEYPWSSACGRFAMDEFPQGLKPLSREAICGTVKTVPLQKRALSKPLQEVRLKHEAVVEVAIPTEKAKRRSIRDFAFVGMWKTRKDIPDGLTYVNRLRDKPRG